MALHSARHLADFLNHGVLPFVGRDTEMRQVYDFWKQTIDAESLRILLVVGEAGIGKSRLVEELVPKISAAGGAVIHTKLYPDSSTTITPLLARSISHSGIGRELLKKELRETRESLADGLRHIAGLRPTIVFIEDIHLLSADGIREFAAILESLADEMISFCIVSRPSLQQARSVVERFLTHEVRLEGLDHHAFRSVCDELFDGTIDAETVRLIEKATLGNSLALRSALRGALKSGYLARRTEIDRWQMTVPPEAFVRHLEHNVRSLSEGLAAHLQEDEQAACNRLAILGELFSHEAATSFLTDATGLLERLSFKGILVPTVSAIAPLAGEPSRLQLYAFSHTLLHKYFYEQANMDPSELAALLSNDVPFYSIAPFLKLASMPPPVHADASVVRSVILKADEIAGELDGGSNWELAIAQGSAARMLFRASSDRFTRAEADEIDRLVMRNRLNLFRRQLLSDEYREALAHLYELTENAATSEIAEFRLIACVYEYWYIDRLPRSQRIYRELQAKAADVLESFPSLRLSYPYVVYLSYEARRAANWHDIASLRTIETIAQAILADPDCDDYARSTVVGTILPHMLASIHSKEELASRLELMERIEHEGSYDRVNFPLRKMRLLTAIGRYDDAITVLDAIIPRFERQGMFFTIFQLKIARLGIEIAMGRDAENALDELASLFAALPPDSLDRGRYTTVKNLLPVLVPTCRADLTQRLITTYPAENIPEIAESIALHRLLQGEASATVFAECRRMSSMQPFFAAAMAGADDDTITAAAREALSPEIVTCADVIDRLIVFEVVRNTEVKSVLRTELATSLGAVLEWLLATSSRGYLMGVLSRYGDLLGVNEAKSWKSRIAKLERERTAEPVVTQANDKVVVSMLDAICVERGGITIRIRGARLRSVLGVMTANLMLSEPLAPKEFRLLAAGEKDDADLARKSVNMAVAALRDDLGADAITTKGETPSFDLERVRIDVLEASDLIDDAQRSVRRGSLARAMQELSQSYSIVLGKVAFPTLYDSLFEALRDDLDARLRKVTLDLANRLVQYDDLNGAASILKHYFDAIPEDAEVSALLRRCLEGAGQFAEAARISIKIAATAE
ncbi:MAG: AAA family ATPase [Bacteroidetes bacterium]|nr:AAA family ATPase [Bacteroidota bacterium]